MRHLISLLILTGALAHSGATLAEESTLPKTDCTVYCPIDQKCTAQVIGARRPRSVAEALTKPEPHRR